LIWYPRIGVLEALLWGLLWGAVFGATLALVSYAMTGGARDFICGVTCNRSTTASRSSGNRRRTPGRMLAGL
jgi:hypothetical protein